MKAIVLRTYGGPEELKLEEIPRPSAAPDEALVRVCVCGVCHLDLILRSGMRARLTLPRVLGHELAGGRSSISLLSEVRPVGQGLPSITLRPRRL